MMPRYAPPLPGLPFDFGEDPVFKPLTITVERILDPLDIAQVRAEPDDHVVIPNSSLRGAWQRSNLNGFCRTEIESYYETSKEWIHALEMDGPDDFVAFYRIVRIKIKSNDMIRSGEFVVKR